MRGFLAVFLVMAAGCSAPATSKAPPNAPPPDDGVASGGCKPGARPTIDGSCVAVGAVAPAGFRAIENGWGFTESAPSGACADGRRVLDASECVADDDCEKPFPPDGASKTVRTSAELAAAVASAAVGSTIALEAGDYDAVKIEKSLHLVGRCARKVVFRGAAERGIWVQREVDVSVDSVTVDGFQAGVVASYGPEVTLTNVIIKNAQIGIVAGEATVRVHGGLVEGAPGSTPQYPLAAAAQDYATITLTGVDVRNAGLFSAGKKAELRFERSVLLRTDSKKGTTIQAYAGGRLELAGSAVRTGATRLVDTARSLPLEKLADAPPPTLRIADSSIVQEGAYYDDGLIRISEGTKLEMANTSIDHRAAFAMMVGDPDSKITIESSTVRAPKGSAKGRNGLYVTLGASAEVTGTAFIDPTGGAATVANPKSRLVLRGVLVKGTTASTVEHEGEKSTGSMPVAAARGASLAIADTSFVANERNAVSVASKSRAELEKVLFDDTLEATIGGWGDALIAAEEAQVWIRSSTFRRSAGSALMFMNAAGIVEKSSFADNGFDLSLDEAKLVEASAASDTIQPKTVLCFDNTYSAGKPTVFEGPTIVPVDP